VAEFLDTEHSQPVHSALKRKLKGFVKFKDSFNKEKHTMAAEPKEDVEDLD
jgi:hypothetical protein